MLTLERKQKMTSLNMCTIEHYDPIVERLFKQRSSNLDGLLSGNETEAEIIDLNSKRGFLMKYSKYYKRALVDDANKLFDDDYGQVVQVSEKLEGLVKSSSRSDSSESFTFRTKDNFATSIGNSSFARLEASRPGGFSNQPNHILENGDFQLSMPASMPTSNESSRSNSSKGCSRVSSTAKSGGLRLSHFAPSTRNPGRSVSFAITDISVQTPTQDDDTRFLQLSQETSLHSLPSEPDVDVTDWKPDDLKKEAVGEGQLDKTLGSFGSVSISGDMTEEKVATHRDRRRSSLFKRMWKGIRNAVGLRYRSGRQC